MDSLAGPPTVGASCLFMQDFIMQIDIQWLKDNFRTFNARYFDSLLPEPRFYIGRSKTRLGSLSYKRGLIWGRKPFFRSSIVMRGKGEAFTLTMSNYFDQTEYQFRNVLLHEMIHLSIASSGVKDTSSHGIVFRGLMDRLNREGWHIQVTTPMNGTPKAYTGSTNIIRQYLVLGIVMDNGKHFLSSVNPKFARQLNVQLQAVPHLRQYAWFTTSDRWFEDFPKVRSLRGRLINETIYNEKTATMQPVKV